MSRRPSGRCCAPQTEGRPFDERVAALSRVNEAALARIDWRGDAAADIALFEAATSLGAAVAGRGLGRIIGKNFADEAKLKQHFEKHGSEFGAKTTEEYLETARDVVRDGYKVRYTYKEEERIGFVQFMGITRKGETKFAFVGTNSKGEITTLHTKRGKDLWKTLNNEATDATLERWP